MLKWLSLHRWENYCLLAMASVACLLVVAARTEARVAPTAVAPALSQSIYMPRLVRPESRSNEPQWVRRHNKILAEAKRGDIDVMLLGDSLTQGWEFNKKTWTAHFPNQRVLNAGIASDRVEHILWRVQHGLLDKARPKTVVLMGGVNNLALSNPDAIADGLRQIIAEIQKRSPKTKVIVQGLFPTGQEASNHRRAKVRLANLKIASLADGSRVDFYDFGERFLQGDGWISKKIMFDYLHLTRAGYEIWATALEAKLAR